MVSDAVNGKIVQVIVDAVELKSYPDADEAAYELPPAALSELSKRLLSAKDTVESQIRFLSREVAPDVDEWIARAKQVQGDIEKSKHTARSIVEQAEAQAQLRHSVHDTAQKVQLLQNELEFSNGLHLALSEIKATQAQLSQAKTHLVNYELRKAFGQMQACSSKLDLIEDSYAPNAAGALMVRLRSLKSDLKDLSEDHLRRAIRVDPKEHTVDLSLPKDQQGDVSLDTCADILAQLETIGDFAGTLSNNASQALLLPLTSDSPNQRSGRLRVEGMKAQFVAGTECPPVEQTLEDICSLVAFLDAQLPAALVAEMQQVFASTTLQRLEANVLTPSIPLEVERVHELQVLSQAVGKLSSVLEARGWPGNERLQAWTENAPRLWLARQREHTLGTVRVSLAKDLRQLRQAEKARAVDAQDEEDDDEMNGWDEDWNDQAPTAEISETGTVKAAGTDEEDSSAWEAGEKPATTTSSTNGGTSTKESASEPKTAKKPRTDTLEAYTITGVPEAFLRACEEVLTKAKSLTKDDYSQTAVASAVTALYSVPTLAAALYRAMALTAYDNLENGKLLLHNDAIWLAEHVTAFADNQAASAMPPSAQRKLQQETSMFENFAQLAYKAEMESQKTILYDLMDGAQGFTNCTTQPFAEECDSAIEITVDRIGRVHSQWQDVLTRSALLHSVGSLLSAAVTKFMIDIQELADIGEEESKQLLAFHARLTSLGSLFKDQDRDMTVANVQDWLKFQYLGEILDGSLADIKYLWIEGELSLEFDEDEVCDLIRALFADSDHRRRAISAIKASRR